MTAAKRDIIRRGKSGLRDVAYGIALLTRLPVPLDVSGAAARGGAAAWGWPLAGAVVALLCGALGWILGALGLVPGLTAGLVLASAIILTGAMHEDGLADTADGLWGGWEPERRLEIMRDSRIGTYGVLALCLSVLLRWQALTALTGADMLMPALIAAAVLSRAPMAGLMAALPSARDAGLSSSVGTPSVPVALAGAGIAIVIAMIAVGPGAVLLGCVAGLMAATCGAIAKAKIGGQTGDILGATQQMCEIAVLIVWVALAA